MATVWTIATSGGENDIALDGLKNLATRRDADALANIILNRQQTVTGELQYNTEAGMPYFTTVFANSRRDMRIFEAFMVADAEAVPEVRHVNTFAAETDGENLKFDMNIATTYGDITVTNG